jgi:sugar lactone lactonase YvrE
LALNNGISAGYDASQLGVNGGPAPSVALTVTGSPILEDGAFDRSGNLWVANWSNALIKYTPAQLATTGSPTPSVTISPVSGSLNSPAGMAFDSNGNLWVANSASLVQFTPAQLATTGTPAPNVTITGGSVNRPVGLAFDSGNNLWAANLSGSTLVKFTPTQLATGTPTAAVTLSNIGTSIVSPFHLAFDAAGNLWVSNYGGQTIVQFTAAQIAANGSPTPTVVLSANAGSLSGPGCVAFDTGGNLWVVNTTGHTIVKFTAAQIAATGNPVPSVIITGVTASDGAGCAFGPPPMSSPIYR